LGDFQENAQQGNGHFTKSEVKDFYNQFGWQEKAGIYQDAQDSEDLRNISADYILQCHLRLNRYLPKQGQYLLDVASGPIQYHAYLSYSAHYDYRICADISIQALKAAKKKLGNKGIYLLCDVTHLPLKNDVIDAQISLHTLYHVPAQEQANAFAELYRALKPGGTSVIVYSWGSGSLLMNGLMLPYKIYSLIKRKFLSSDRKKLYFHAHSYQWFCQEIQAKYQTQIFTWRSVNVPFLKLFVHRFLGGRMLLKLIYWLEERLPRTMGRIGAYPLFVSKK
jgi:ubiquinone/menaquinone biosynthesis C-methylase UbiE